MELPLKPRPSLTSRATSTTFPIASHSDDNVSFSRHGLDAPKPHHRRHKHSKSRELRLPRPMSHLAASAGARGLLPTWSGGKERDHEDDRLLRPETSRTRWASDSTSGLGTVSRKGSVLDTPEPHGRLGPIRRQSIRSTEDLEQVKKRRQQGEE